jgi:phage-related protein
MAIVGEAHVIVKAITTGFQRQIDDAIKNANLGPQGSAAGKAFGRGFSSGTSAGLRNFGKEVEQARLRLASLTRTSYFVGPAISAAVTALSSLVSGLYAMGSQIAVALPSLIVLPSLFSAMAQSMLTAKLAFSGIGKAIGALNKSTKGRGGIDRMPGLLEAYAAAQERVVDADKRVLKAREALIEANKRAIESLQQLNFEAEDAAISEKRAALALEDARNTLARVQDLPPNNRARMEAELAFAEADLNYRRAIDRNADLAEETERRNEAGVEGSEEVLSAEENLLESIEQQQKALINLAKAQKALNDARRGKGGGGGGGEDPLAGLTKEAASFAKFISSLSPEFNKLKASAGTDLFPALEIAIGNLATKLFPMLNDILRKTGKSLGIAAISFSDIFTEASNLKNIDRVAETNRDSIEKLGKVFGNLASTFFSLLAAADPLIRRFTDWLVVITEGWKNTREAKRESGELTEKFNRAGDAAAQIGRILGNLFTALKDIGKAASGPGSGGQMLMDSFEGATQKFEDFVKKISADGSLQQFFRDIVPTVESIGRFVVELAEQFLKLGDNEGTSKLFDSLTNSLPIIAQMFDILGEAAPALGEFIESLVGVFLNFTESGSINVFFAILTRVLDMIGLVFGNATVQKVFGVLAVIKAAMIAISTIATVFSFFGKAIVGTIAKLIGLGNTEKGLLILQKLKTKLINSEIGQRIWLRATIIKEAAAKKIAAGATKAWAGVTKAATIVTGGFTKAMNLLKLAVISNPFVAIVVGIVALIAILVVAYKKFDWFRRFVDAIFRGIMAVVDVVLDAIAKAFSIYWGVITGAISFAWNNIIKPVFNAIADVFKGVWDTIVKAFNFYWGVITGAISFAWNNIIKPVFNAIAGVFKGVWDGIKKTFQGVWDFITRAVSGAVAIFGGVRDTIVNAFKSAVNFIIRAWNNLDFTIPKVKVGPVSFGGFTIGLPDIPELAQGGIVRPTPGGTLARIAEAGRPERVEPLDPDGLSQRDKAMIKMFTGGAAGATFNIYPSQGMDEVELAALVNRQIAFELRRGAA